LKINREKVECYCVLKDYSNFLIPIKTIIIKEYHRKKETIYSLYPETSIKLIIKSWKPSPKVDKAVIRKFGNCLPVEAFESKV
jgi:hypothetical protein